MYTLCKNPRSSLGSVGNRDTRSRSSQKRVTPLLQALVTIVGLLRVGSARQLEPVDEQLLIFFKQQKLAENCICLPKKQFQQELTLSRIKHTYVVLILARKSTYWAIILTLSYPFSIRRAPSTSPIPASSLTSFSPIGSDTKFLCF